MNSKLIDEIAKEIATAEGKLFALLSPVSAYTLVVMMKPRAFRRLLCDFAPEVRCNPSLHSLIMGYEIWECDDLDVDFTVALVPKKNFSREEEK